MSLGRESYRPAIGAVIARVVLQTLLQVWPRQSFAEATLLNFEGPTISSTNCHRTTDIYEKKIAHSILVKESTSTRALCNRHMDKTRLAGRVNELFANTRQSSWVSVPAITALSAN